MTNFTWMVIALAPSDTVSFTTHLFSRPYVRRYSEMLSTRLLKHALKRELSDTVRDDMERCKLAQQLIDYSSVGAFDLDSIVLVVTAWWIIRGEFEY